MPMHAKVQLHVFIISVRGPNC